jgi:hypothetical protein
MTRVRIPVGLTRTAGVYEIAAGAIDGRCLAKSEANEFDLTQEWDELREAPGVEIECTRHPGRWWPTVGKDISLTEAQCWRCPNCAWAFRQGLADRGGTPQF